MSDITTAPAPDDALYINVYTLHKVDRTFESLFDTGVFVSCLGTATRETAFDALLALPQPVCPKGHFISFDEHPGADFTISPPASP